MSSLLVRTKNKFQTARLGRIIAKEILRTIPENKAFVVALFGELGSGKTTFVQGFSKELGVKQGSPSPTFLLVRAYPIKYGRTLYHIDCYRIKSLKELIALGLRDWIKHQDHILIIEWAEKIKSFLPGYAVRIYFSHGKTKNERIIEIVLPKSKN